MRLLGKKASFIPSFYQKNRDHGGSGVEGVTPIVGRITFVNRPHGWFMVSYRAGETIQREGFKFCDIGEWVKVHG